jgi:hypothetical protein
MQWRCESTCVQRLHFAVVARFSGDSAKFYTRLRLCLTQSNKTGARLATLPSSMTCSSVVALFLQRRRRLWTNNDGYDVYLFSSHFFNCTCCWYGRMIGKFFSSAVRMCQWPTGIILLNRFCSLSSCLIIGKLCVPNTAFVLPAIALAIKIALSCMVGFSRRSVNRSGRASLWRKYCGWCG